MKKVLLLVAVMMVTVGARGQAITLTKGAEGKTVDVEMVQNGIYVCSDEGFHYWLTRTEDGPKSFVREDDWQLVKVDRDLNVAGRLELPQTNRCAVAVSMRDEGRAAIVLVDSSDRQRTVLLRAVVELDSMQLEGHKIDTLAKYEYGKKDRCLVWSATSQDGAYWGVLALVQHTAQRQYEAEAMIYSRSMEQLWRREYAVGTVEDMVVTSEGEMVTLGKEREGGEELFLFNLLTPRTSETYRVTVGCDPVQEIRIANVVDRRVVCMGTFAPWNADPDDRLTGGVMSMAFDLDSASMPHFTMRPFENEDVNILLNKKTKKVQKDREVPMVTPLAVAPTPYGAVMAFGHRYVLRSRNSNGTVTTTYYAQGIHLVAVDNGGEMMWVKNLRRNDQTDDDDAMLYMALFAHEGTVCLVKKEHKKYPSDYNIAKEAQEFEMEDKGNLVLYRVDEEGEVKKDVLEKKTKHSLLSAAKVNEGKVLLLTAHGNKTRMMEVDFE